MVEVRPLRTGTADVLSQGRRLLFLKRRTLWWIQRKETRDHAGG